jgi:very-short-patch-repair endonuclease
LVIEIDGSSHLTKGEYDMLRQNKLQELGFTIIRYKEGEVLNGLDEIARDIRNVIYSIENKV